MGNRLIINPGGWSHACVVTLNEEKSEKEPGETTL
jgi:hypothetical protein